LRLAAKVVDILATSFPYVIDRLAPEFGDFDGPAPVVFSGFSSEIFVPRKIGTTSSISEFGADQVLIVRDKETKLLLSKEIGNGALILTILESKGMEFQDVFLYNFFSDSLCQTGFRALANSQLTGLRLDDIKHAELCVELKVRHLPSFHHRCSAYLADVTTELLRSYHTPERDVIYN